MNQNQQQCPRRGMPSSALTTGMILLGMSVAAQCGEWKYVAPPRGDPFEHPTLRALVMSPQRPEDVRVMVSYRGARQRYTQLRYGSPGSIRMTVVLDEIAPGDADLYVDSNRNRRIEPTDRVIAEARVWRLPLSVAVVRGEVTDLTPRAAIFRLGATGLTFSFAAAGYMEGQIKVGGSEHAARRTDGDGNGFFTDAADRLWIDLDDDGHWDPTREQFLYAPLLSLGDVRYSLRSDELGNRLALETIDGTGTIKLALHRPASASRVSDARATLIGRDGSAVSVSGDEQAVTVPVGEYRLGTLTIALDDPAGGPTWTFIFSDNGGKPDQRWYKVAKGAAVEIDPVGKLEMETGVEEQSQSVHAGEELALQPRLYTGDGLLINMSFRGTPAAPATDDGPGAQIKLTGTAERSLGVARSGFA